MKDTFTSGFLAGVTSGFVTNALSLFFGFLQLTTLRYADWTGIIIFGHTPPFSTGEIAFALAANIGFMGVLGIIFAYLIPLMSSANLLFKGWVFSTFAWLLIYAVTTLFKVDGTMSVPFEHCNRKHDYRIDLRPGVSSILTEIIAKSHCFREDRQHI